MALSFTGWSDPVPNPDASPSPDTQMSQPATDSEARPGWFTSGETPDGRQGKRGQRGQRGEGMRKRMAKFDATGTVYVADTENNRIQRFAKDGTHIGSFGTAGDGKDNFYKPTDILIDRNGALFIVDSGNNRIKKHDAQGLYVTEWGKRGSLAREFDNPQQICESRQDGTIYIADTNNNRVQKYHPRKSPLFQQDQGVQIPTKPRAPGASESPLTGLPEVPSDEPTPGATGKPSATPSPAATAAPATPDAEPTRF